MPRFVTYTTNEDPEPVAIPLEDFEDLPDNWADFVHQEAPDAETAVRDHDLKLDIHNALINAGKETKEYY